MGEVYATKKHICRALDRLEDSEESQFSEVEKERKYRQIATDRNFARMALGKKYDCSFTEYYQDRTFVDPLDPTQGIEAHALCPNGYDRSVTIHNIREWVMKAKYFMLHEGVIGQASAFKAGIDDFFSSECLRLFTSEELQKDVCGMGDNVDNWDEDAIRKLFQLGGKGTKHIEALVAVAAIGGNAESLSRRFDPSSSTIKFVVKALLEASPKQRRQFLSFVTSLPIVTPGLIEIVPITSSSGNSWPFKILDAYLVLIRVVEDFIFPVSNRLILSSKCFILLSTLSRSIKDFLSGRADSFSDFSFELIVFKITN